MPKFVWNLDPVLVHVGSFALRYYSLLFVGVFLGGFWLLRWQIVRGGGDEEDASDFITYGVVGVLAGARLGHVLFYDLDKALADPIWVFKIWKGGLASHGAVIGLIVAMFYFTRKKGVSWLEGSDRFSYSAALGATLVRAGNFFNSEIVGRIVPGQTWGVKFPRYDRAADLADVPYRYPSQLFEVVLGLLVLGSLYVIDRAAGKEKRPRGLMIFSFFAIYFTGRIFVELFKEYQAFDQFKGITDSTALTMGQMLSIPGALLGYWGIYWSLKTRLPVGWPGAVDEEDEDEEDEDEDEEDYHGDPDVDELFDERDAERSTRKATPDAPQKKTSKPEKKHPATASGGPVGKAGRKKAGKKKAGKKKAGKKKARPGKTGARSEDPEETGE